MAQKTKKNTAVDPASVTLAPLILIKSGEDILGEQARATLQKQALNKDPETEIVRIDAAHYTAGDLTIATSPSLFGETKFVRIDNLENLNDELANDLKSYSETPVQDIYVVLTHHGGNKGLGVIRAISKAQHPIYDFPAFKYDSEKAEFIQHYATQNKRTITKDAIHSLVDALGSDMRELFAALKQLFNDIDGTIDNDAVHTYYAGRKEATGFDVADAAISGQTGKAIALARHAIATGTHPVPIVAALAMKLRSMALVLGARSHNRTLTMAPWQINQAKKELAHWSGEGLAHAITAVAQADADVKGASRDPIFAVERAIIRIGRARRMPR